MLKIITIAIAAAPTVCGAEAAWSHLCVDRNDTLQ